MKEIWIILPKQLVSTKSERHAFNIHELNFLMVPNFYAKDLKTDTTNTTGPTKMLLCEILLQKVMRHMTKEVIQSVKKSFLLGTLNYKLKS